MLSNEQFDRTRRLALSLAGIELLERHRELFVHRSRRLGILDRAGLDSLLTAAEQGETSAIRQLLCLLTTKFTGFFRHPRHFDIAAEHALQAARQRGRARLWSAAAATGEEPYSLAMALLEVFPSDQPPASILATDVDEEALAIARRGDYGESMLKGLEQERRERFLKMTSVTGPCSITPAVRALVNFQALNLTDITWPVEGLFDVIFCRNVLMYLEACHRYAVAERLASLLAPDGILLLDPAEHLGKAGHLFSSGADGVYLRRKKATTHPNRPASPPSSVEQNRV